MATNGLIIFYKRGNITIAGEILRLFEEEYYVFYDAERG